MAKKPTVRVAIAMSEGVPMRDSYRTRAGVLKPGEAMEVELSQVVNDVACGVLVKLGPNAEPPQPAVDESFLD